jgi:membrane protein involved in colicin uptake
MEDRVALDGIMLKCNDPSSQRQPGPECEVARVAIERLAQQNEAAEQAKRQQEFERNREKLRQLDEQRARAQAQQKQVDPYTMPVVPVDPSSAATTPNSGKP